MRRNPWLLGGACGGCGARRDVGRDDGLGGRSDALAKRHSALAGTWSGRYSGAFSGTFTLHWTQSGSSLRGSIALSYPRGKYGISGSVQRQRHQVRGRRCGRHLHGLSVGQVDVGQLQEPARRRQVERSQDLLTDHASTGREIFVY